ncbi:hypothetical protein ACHAXA_005022 [Cyclostephanos tholiformis]|uniref:Uncharacterized protein n=1 Tax=Cyclostephanos tholiformis TaxID=382380 RepID=A0ABD3RYU3_9STRA
MQRRGASSSSSSSSSSTIDVDVDHVDRDIRNGRGIVASSDVVVVVGGGGGGGGGGATRRRKSTSLPPHRRRPHLLLPRPIVSLVLLLCVGAMLLFSSSSNSKRRSSTSMSSTLLSTLRARRRIEETNMNHDVEDGRRSSSSTGGGNVRDVVGIYSPRTNSTIHLIFSTDCGSFQHWQSYLFFHSAYKVGQPGYVTRIASGCTDDEREEESTWHDLHVRNVMSDRYRIHFTPRFSGVRDEVTGEVRGDYKFFNKPYGLRHFLEHGDLMGLDASSKTSNVEGWGGRGGVKGRLNRPDDVIILADPDFLLLRPLTDDFSDDTETLVGKRRSSAYRRMADVNGNVVSRGRPYAQAYGLGTQWRKFDLENIAGSTSPARDVSQSDGALYYPVGPPYVAIASDMYDIALSWSEFVPRVYAEYPHLLAEMYAYCIAAAHLRLPHTIIDSMMVSAVGNGGGGAGGEGWEFVRDVPAGEVCEYGMRPNHDVRRVPSAIHYCQHYAVARYMFGKRRVPHDIFTCDHPPLLEPPIDLGSGRYPWVESKRGSKRMEMNAGKEKLEAFMVCSLTRATNDALAFFKTNANCSSGGKGDDGKRTYDMWAGEETSLER